LAVGKTEKIESREQGVANWQLAIGREEKDGNLLHFSTSQLLHF
jgi:hypothetical protein